MATTIIEYPQGQHAQPDGKVKLKIRYTGPAPNPNDIHFYVREVGDSHYRDKPDAEWAIDPNKPELEVSWPVGPNPGSYDFRVDWTWTKPGQVTRQEKGREGQFFVDKKFDAGWCIWFIAFLMAIGGLIGGFAFGPSLIGYAIGLAVGFGLGNLLCILWHWVGRSEKPSPPK
jgi:hypothetical protein